jgi:hypothetical protein
MKFNKINKWIFTVDDFMSAEECEKWINFSENQGYEIAKINAGFDGQQVNTSVRNNERVIYDSVELAEELWQRVKDFVPPEADYKKAYGLNERFRFYKYSQSQRFRLHKDASFFRDFEEWSCYTFMVYLNENFVGGETKFPPDCTVKPATGKALIFKHELLHEGCPVIEGLKYVLRTDIMYKRQ